MLVLGEHLGEHPVDAELGCDRFGHLAGVAGDHRHLDTEPLQLLDRLSGFGADLVFHREGACHFSVLDHVQNGRSPPHPFRHGPVYVLGNFDAPFGEERPATQMRSVTA